VLLCTFFGGGHRQGNIGFREAAGFKDGEYRPVVYGVESIFDFKVQDNR
jgi:hypothetical protein